MNKKISRVAMICTWIVTFAILIGISMSLISVLRINNGDPNIRSDADLTCSFTVSSSTSVNVTWYRNSAQNLTAIVNCTSGVECFTSLGSGTIPSSFTTKGDTWNCSIAFFNGTGSESSTVSTTIQDTPPTEPRIYYTNGTEIVNFTINISEDTGLSFIINSTDSDSDSITYAINDTTFCSINASSGGLTCLPTLESHVGLRTLLVQASAALASTGKILTINITAANDAPTFSPNVSSQNLTEAAIFNYYLSGFDFESNYPLNLVVVNVSPSLSLNVTTINNSAFLLMLDNNRTATFAEASVNYTVTLRLNDTDNITSTPRNTTVSFQLNGITFNHLPNISYFVHNDGSITQGGDLHIYINASDTDNNSLSFATNNPLYNITFNSSMQYGVVANASFRYAYINVTSLTNYNVINHNFTLYVFDGAENATQVIDINIANTNDAPIIHEFSNHSSNSYSNTNLSRLIAYTGVNFIFQVNATDIDDYTYDSGSTGLGVYTTNDSSYGINSSTGRLSFVPSLNGNFTFIVTATDFAGSNYNFTASIEVLNNSDPQFTQDPISISCFEFDSINWNNRCYYNLSSNVTDADATDYIASFVTNATFFTVGSTNGIINFSANQTDIGNHSIFLNVTDSRGGSSTTTIYVIITNTNNPPSLASPTMPSGNLIVGNTYSIIYAASDLDLQLSSTYEDLNFSGVITGTNTTIFTLSQLNETHAELLITPILENYEGNYSINVTVTDAFNNISSRFMYLYIYNATAAPNISQIRPYGTPLNSTINNLSFANTSSFPGMITNISIYENLTYVFNQTSTADNSSYPNFLNFSWYLDGTFAGLTRNYTKYFDFFTNGTHNITFIASDQFGSNSSFTWIVNVTNVNRPPSYNNNSLENLTISGSGFIPNYFTYSSSIRRFYDADDDSASLGYNTDNTTTLTYSSTSCAHANFSFEQNRLNVAAGSIGECYIIFTATDPMNTSMSVSSQMVLINITNVSQSTTQTVTQTRSSGSSSSPVTVPVPQEVEKPKPLQILTPQLVTTYKNSTIKVPIVVNNTWNDTLIGITLEALTNASNVTLYMDDVYIPMLEPGESLTTALYISNYKGEGHYEIQLKANVTFPEYEDTATIFINSAELNSVGEELDSKISFAQDLLSSNPECQELHELLQQAKSELATENYASTAKIVDTVLNGCKFLVNEAAKKESPERDFIKTFEWRRSYNDYLIIGFFAMLFGITLFYILKKDKDEQAI